HAHELLFGFALAVVAGYLLGPQPLRITLALLAAWALARLGWLFWPGGWLAILSAALFATTLAWKVVPRFWGADRKSTRLNSSHVKTSYAVFCLKKKKTTNQH